MVEPSQDIGTIFFALTILFMIACAGVASLPPARNLRVLTGAAIMSGAWFVILSLQNYFDRWDVSSSFFFLDIVYATGFYFLSVPPKETDKKTAQNYNWAGYVVAVFFIMIVLQIIHFLAIREFMMKPAFIGLSGLISFALFVGFARGFGLAATIWLGAFFIIMNITALFYYVESSNFLTYVVLLIIIRESWRSASSNIKSWMRQRKGQDEDEQTGVKSRPAELS